MYRYVAMMIFVFIACFPSDAVCSDNTESAYNRFYGSLHAGAFQGNNDAGKIKADGSGYGYGLGAGYFFRRNFAIGAEFMYFTVDYVRDSSDLAPGTSSNNIDMFSIWGGASFLGH